MPLRHLTRLALLLLLTGYSCQGISQQEKSGTAAVGNPSTSKENTTERSQPIYKVTKTDQEWQAQLSEAQYYVLRKAGTERAFTSPLLEEKRTGTFVCAGCGNPLYASQHKYESYSGWPSFDRAIDGQVGYDVDYKIGYKRTEVHCANCGGHLGHVFDDGPARTTGMRHCINGLALSFVPEDGKR